MMNSDYCKRVFSSKKKKVEFQVNHCRPITEEEGCDKDYLPYTYGLKV